MIKHKEALYEILDKARTDPSGSLSGKCDIILKSAGTNLPGDVFDFIALGDFTFEDVVTGDLKDKYVTFYQDIICGSVVKLKETEGEVDAEDKACELARLVRTLLKGNRKLISTSHPNGAATSSSLIGTRSEAVMYSDGQAHVAVISVKIRAQEED